MVAGWPPRAHLYSQAVAEAEIAGDSGSSAHRRRLARSTAIFAAATAGSRVLGLLREVVVRRYFGVEGSINAFTVAFTTPEPVAYTPRKFPTVQSGPMLAMSQMTIESSTGAVLSVTLVPETVVGPASASCGAANAGPAIPRAEIEAPVRSAKRPFKVFMNSSPV